MKKKNRNKSMVDLADEVIEDSNAILYLVQTMITDITEARCLVERLNEIHKKLGSDFETVADIRSSLVEQSLSIIEKTSGKTEFYKKSAEESRKNRDFSCHIDRSFADAHLTVSEQTENHKDFVEETFRWGTEMLKTSVKFLEQFEEIKKIIQDENQIQSKK